MAESRHSTENGADVMIHSQNSEHELHCPLTLGTDSM